MTSVVSNDKINSVQSSFSVDARVPKLQALVYDILPILSFCLISSDVKEHIRDNIRPSTSAVFIVTP